MEKTILREDVPMEISIITDATSEHARVTSLRLSKFIGEYIIKSHCGLCRRVIYVFNFGRL